METIQKRMIPMDVIQELVLPVANKNPDFAHGSLYFVGTATVILRYAGFTILTDPNFLHAGEKVHIGYGLTATRLTNPAINLDELPPIDLVILSHMHEDHFDRTVQKKLAKTIPIVTTPQAAKTLKQKGFQTVYQLKTWQSFYLSKGDALLHITAMPGKHGPGPLNLLMPQVMGSMLEFQHTDGNHTAFTTYITGDTLLYKDLRKIHQRFPDIDLALLHLGGTKIFGIMLTMDGKQGVALTRMIAPSPVPGKLTVIPIHYDDYDAFKSPLDDFVKAFLDSGLENQVRYLHQGDTYTFELAHT